MSSMTEVIPQKKTATIPISEVFGITAQGEGAMIGRPTVFVRTGSCDYRCSWCDSLYAVLPEHRKTWRNMSHHEIFSTIAGIAPEPILITLSGGNPAMHNLQPLIALAHEHGYTLTMETQGSIAKPWFSTLDYLTLSPKPPSSGMGTKWERLDQCCEMASQGGTCETNFKVVVFNDDDYAYAHAVAERYPDYPFYLQAGNPNPPQVGDFDINRVLDMTRWLIGKVVAERWNDVIVLPQMHTLLWGNTRGV
jgi:7-carboxy-7-deazaguanine synthase